MEEREHVNETTVPNLLNLSHSTYPCSYQDKDVDSIMYNVQSTLNEQDVGRSITNAFYSRDTMSCVNRPVIVCLVNVLHSNALLSG